MMKKTGIIFGIIAVVVAAGCNKTRRSPGRAYMPDMSNSRAYETYASTANLKEKGINYTALPVPGSIAREDMTWVYPYKNDSIGYINAAKVVSPVNPADVDLKEAERLYLINCGICHGAKLDGNGPLWQGGDGPYPAAPKDLLAADMKALTPGTMFHSITYGKGQMGSYASQLNTKQRWEVIQYIKNKQNGGGQPSAAIADSAVTTP